LCGTHVSAFNINEEKEEIMREYRIMDRKKRKTCGWLSMLLISLLLLLTACGQKPLHAGEAPAQKETLTVSRSAVSASETSAKAAGKKSGQKEKVKEDGEYSDKDHVAEYLHQYGHLPSNYITKKEAEALGWDSRAGNLWKVAPGKSIGGSRFGNYEGFLPEKNGRKYFECDIDFDGGYRGAKRIIYSNDGLIFYTEDHYETFEQLY